MKINNLEKASKIFTVIKAIDERIIHIEKYAIQIANGGYNIKLNLSFEKTEKENKVSIDEDGSLAYGDKLRETGGLLWFMREYQTIQNVGKKEEVISENIDETTALKMLGVMLAELQEARLRNIKAIEKLGFNF